MDGECQRSLSGSRPTPIVLFSELTTHGSPASGIEGVWPDRNLCQVFGVLALPLNCDDNHSLICVVDPNKCVRENADVIG